MSDPAPNTKRNRFAIFLATVVALMLFLGNYLVHSGPPAEIAQEGSSVTQDASDAGPATSTPVVDSDASEGQPEALQSTVEGSQPVINMDDVTGEDTVVPVEHVTFTTDEDAVDSNGEEY